MAGVADAEAWTESTEMANGRSIALSTLTEDPRVSLLFMRLPDGGYPAGEGTAPQFESLMKLWNQGNGGSPAWPEITTVVGATPAATYASQGLVDTLAEVIGSYEPRWIATQNYTGVFPVGSEEPVDHPDHVATAKFVREAQQAYLGFHQLIGYEDYETEKEAANVSGELLEGKEKAFAAYEEHDMSCDKGESCEELYDDWLARQYRDASETRGVVANAGYAQTVDSEEGVSLDGSLSSAEEGLEPLAYEWRQVAGPAVALGGAETDEPSFAAPPAEASLAFSLTVSSGAQVSAPDVVSVEVEGPDPTPSAAAGAAQTVESKALVTLHGSGVNPYLQPLGYEWRQVAGPAVALSGADTPTPSFVAPSGPASLEFSLEVSNAAGGSAPALTTVTVLPEDSADHPGADPPATGRSPASDGPPASGAHGPVPKLSRRRVGLRVPRRGRVRKVVSVRGEAVRVWCTGRLPRGARRRVAGGRRVLIEATPAVRSSGRYRLWVHALTDGRVVTRTLVVRLLRSRSH